MRLNKKTDKKFKLNRFSKMTMLIFSLVFAAIGGYFMLRTFATPTNPPGDVNSDNTVNIFDLSILLSNWNRTGMTGAQGDLNSDGSVNIFDLSLLLTNWGEVGTPVGSGNDTPETEGYPRTSAEIAALIQNIEAPTDTSEGKFRTNCSFSHNAWEDPIVFPGAVASHLHSFFGNTSVSRNSTWQSLRQASNSTCAGGVLNNTAYWYPALIDQNGKVRAFETATIYYTCSVTSANPSASCAATEEMPKGMRFVAGYDMSLTPAQNAGNQQHYGWRCTDASGNERAGTSGPVMPVCNIGEHLYMRFNSPECWNGVNTDSPNHRSHIAYASYIGQSYPECPAGYPKKIPVVTIQLNWVVSGANTSDWHVASDRMPGMTHPNGQTWHADWFGAWEPVVQTAWHNNCVRAHIACNFDTTGPISGQGAGSKRLQSPPAYTGPKILDQPAP